MLELNYKCVQCSYRFRYVLKPTLVLYHIEDNLTPDFLKEEILPEGKDIPEGYEIPNLKSLHSYGEFEYFEDLLPKRRYLCESCIKKSMLKTFTCFLCGIEHDCWTRRKVRKLLGSYLSICIACGNEHYKYIFDIVTRNKYFYFIGNEHYYSWGALIRIRRFKHARKLPRKTDC